MATENLDNLSNAERLERLLQFIRSVWGEESSFAKAVEDTAKENPEDIALVIESAIQTLEIAAAVSKL